MEIHEQIRTKRESAIRARRLAVEISSAADQARALAFAAELEAQADVLEDQLIGSSLPPNTL
jgi:hypothetical protein